MSSINKQSKKKIEPKTKISEISYGDRYQIMFSLHLINIELFRKCTELSLSINNLNKVVFDQADMHPFSMEEIFHREGIEFLAAKIFDLSIQISEFLPNIDRILPEPK